MRIILLALLFLFVGVSSITAQSCLRTGENPVFQSTESGDAIYNLQEEDGGCDLTLQPNQSDGFTWLALDDSILSNQSTHFAYKEFRKVGHLSTKGGVDRSTLKVV